MDNPPADNLVRLHSAGDSDLPTLPTAPALGSSPTTASWPSGAWWRARRHLFRALPTEQGLSLITSFEQVMPVPFSGLSLL